MILESLIQDESKVTFDCAKATIEKGSRIQIDDIYWKSIEVQNAIKCNLVALVGPPPNLPEDAPNAEPEKKIRFRNTFSTKLCFECIKDYADPGMIVHVPPSKLDEPEIRNAINAGWLMNEDNPEMTPPKTHGAPVELEELTASDLIENPEVTSIFEALKPAKEQPLPENIPAKRPKKQAPATQIKAKKIGKGDAMDEDEAAGDELYKESQVIDKKAGPKKAAPKAAPVMIEDEEDNPGDDDFDFIFSNNQPKKKK